MPDVSVQRLFDENREKLQLSWIAGQKGSHRSAPVGSLTDPRAGIIAHLNLTHPHRFQVLGQMETSYLQRLDGTALQRAFDNLFEDDAVAAILIADGTETPEALRKAADLKNVPLIASPVPSATLINLLRHYLSQELAEEVTLHGVFMVILEVGVLITGDSAVGKSELALELITRGHGLVADDVVEFYRIGPETLQGRCPPLLRDYLEVRGLGLINIRSIFGETAVRPRKNLKLVVHLERPPGGDLSAMERLPSYTRTQNILGLDVPKVVLPVAVGRNLAVLVEAATRNFILSQRGIDSTEQFIRRQEEYMARQELQRSDPNDRSNP
jgi:HPr kinase/phosphorylase